MAVARVEVCWAASAADRLAVASAVHAAVVRSLRVPSDDPTVIVIDRDPAGVIAPGRVGDRYTLVTVTLFAGRTTETKRRLFQALVAALVGVGVPAGDVLVVLEDVPTTDWGVDGGVPASDLDPGFDIEI